MPACSESELDILNDTIISEYESFISTVSSIETIDDLLAYVDKQMQWRDNTLPLLPNCRKAIELDMLLNQMSSDISALHALRIAGVPSENNPYYLLLENSLKEYTQLQVITITATPTNLPRLTLTYYVIANGSLNIRSCGSTNCGVVATANRGDALAVVDNSSDWYELQLEDGSAGYIADFLVSSNAPSTQPTSAPVQPTAIPQSNDTQSVTQPTAMPI